MLWGEVTVATWGTVSVAWVVLLLMHLEFLRANDDSWLPIFMIFYHCEMAPANLFLEPNTVTRTDLAFKCALSANFMCRTRLIFYLIVMLYSVVHCDCTNKQFLILNLM